MSDLKALFTCHSKHVLFCSTVFQVDPVTGLSASYDGSVVTVQWNDATNNVDDLGYLISFSISARGVVLLTADSSQYNATASPVGYEVVIDRPELVEGVTVEISVQACNMFGLSEPSNTTLTIGTGMVA